MWPAIIATMLGADEIGRTKAFHTIRTARYRSIVSHTMEGTKRANVQPGLTVSIVQKQHQRSGTLTKGIVRDILTNSPSHPHGIKVRLESGEVGRVKEIHQS